MTGEIELLPAIGSLEQTAQRIAPPGQVKLIEVANPFNPNEHTCAFIDHREGMTVRDVVPALLNPATTVISVSGNIVEYGKWGETQVRDTDSVLIMSVPAGGDKDSSSKQILRLVAIIVVMYFAPYLAGEVMGLSGAAATVASAAIVIGSALILTALTPKPKFNSTTDIADSPTYGIDGAKNTSQEGLPVPVCFGKFRMAGNVVDMHIENLAKTQMLYMLINAGEGPVAGISDIKVNDQPIANYEDVEYDVRLGTEDQTPIPWFPSSQVAINKGITLGTTYTTHTGTDPIDRFRIDMVAPMGMFHYKDDGNREPATVDLEIDYRIVGTSTWTALNDEGTVNGVKMAYFYYRRAPKLEYDEERGGGGYTTQRADLHAGDVVIDGIIYDTAGVEVGYAKEVALKTEGNSISRNSSSPVRWSIISPSLTRGVYEVRVRRTNPETVGAKLVNRVVWGDYVEVTDITVANKNTALVAIKVRLDDQLNNVPNVTYLNHGVVVPVFEGGQWVNEPTNNPAWVAFTALVHTRFGGGYDVDSRLDLQAFVEWAAYCKSAELTCDIVFDQTNNLWDQLQEAYRCGHARPIMKGTRFSVAVEKPTSPSMMFTSSNILKDSFNQSWTGVTGRANAIEASYFDKDDDYKPHIVRVYDPGVGEDAPEEVANVTLYGVTDLDRATKEAVFMLRQNRYFTSTISFQAYVDSLACTVGDTVLVQHDQPQWSQGGRLESGSGLNSLVLDRPVTIGTGTHYALVHYPTRIIHQGTISSILGDFVTISGYSGLPVSRLVKGSIDRRVSAYGTTGVHLDDTSGLTVGSTVSLYKNDAIETAVVSNAPGEYTTLTLSSSLPEAPVKYSQFMVGPVLNVVQQWRIVGLDGAGDLKRTLRCVNYDERVYDWTIDAGEAVPMGTYHRFVPHVINLAASEVRRLVGRTYESVVDLSWSAPADYVDYDGADIYVRENDGPYTLAGQVRGALTEFSYDAQVGQDLTFQVVTHATNNRYAPKSKAPTVSLVTTGDDIAPDAPTALTLLVPTVGLLLEWVNPLDADFEGLKIYRGETNFFPDAVHAYTTAPNQTQWLDAQAHDPTKSYFYWAIATDYAGNESSFVTSVPTSASPLATAGGQESVTGYLTNESHIVVADSSGTVASGGFSTAVGDFRVFEGLLEVSISTTFAVVDQFNCVGTINTSGHYAVTAMTADQASLVVRAVYNGVAIDKVFSLAKSRAGSNGSGSNAATITLSASSQMFTYDASSGTPVALPATQTVNLRANRQNIATAVTWNVKDENGTDITPTPLTSVSGDTAQLTIASFGTRQRVLIRATAGGLFDETTIIRVQSGSNGTPGEPGESPIVGLLSKDSHILPADSAGVVSTYTGANGEFRVYQGLDNVSAQCTFSVFANPDGATVSIGATTGVFNVSGVSNTADVSTITFRAVYGAAVIDRTFTLTKMKAPLAVPALGLSSSSLIFKFDGDGAAAPATQSITFTALLTNVTGNVTWTATKLDAAGASLGAATLTGTGNTRALSIANFATSDSCVVVATLGALSARVTVNRVQDGFKGSSAVTVQLTKEVVNIFAYANGSVLDYSPTINLAKVFSGFTDVTASATFTAAFSNGTVGAFNTVVNVPVAGQPKGFFQVTSMTSDRGTITITAVYNGNTIVKEFQVTKVQIGYEIVATNPTTNLFEGRVVYNTTDDKLWRYSGTAWISVVPASDISGQLTSAQIADLAATKITGQLSDTQIAAIAATKLIGTVSSTQIADDSITSPKIAANAVTASEIAAGSITAGHIVAGSITGDRIAANTIAGDRILANSLTADKILAGSITADRLNIGIATNGASLLPDTNFMDPSLWVPEYRGMPTFDGAGRIYCSGSMGGGNGQGMRLARAIRVHDQKRYRFSVELYNGNTDGLAYVRFYSSTSSDLDTGNIRYGGLEGMRPAAGTWTEYSWEIIPDAMFFMPAILIGHTQNTGIYYARNLRFEEMIGSVKISDGAITASKVAADQITANHIQAGSITAAKIAAGQVTADKMAVSSLSAITGTIGLLRTAASGARTEIESNQIRVYDGGNVMRVRMGVW